MGRFKTCCIKDVEIYACLWTSVMLLQPRTSLKTIMRRIPYGINCGCVLLFFVYILGTFKWTKADDGYSEIDKEAHLIYRGIHKFNTYLFVKHLTLGTHHKSLLRISISSKGLPQCLPHGLNDILTSFPDIYITAYIKVHVLNVNTFWLPLDSMRKK